MTACSTHSTFAAPIFISYSTFGQSEVKCVGCQWALQRECSGQNQTLKCFRLLSIWLLWIWLQDGDSWIEVKRNRTLQKRKHLPPSGKYVPWTPCCSRCNLVPLAYFPLAEFTPIFSYCLLLQSQLHPGKATRLPVSRIRYECPSSHSALRLSSHHTIATMNCYLTNTTLSSLA